LQILFVFLKWVASFAHVDETGNKMDLPNLATVIAPNILCAKGRDPTRQESLASGSLVSEWLAAQDEFFMVPEEFMEIIRDQEYFNGTSDMPSKDFLKRCDQYMKSRFNGRAPLGPGSELTSPVLNGTHSPFHPHGPNFSPSGSSAGTPRDDAEVRLVGQRSDPALSRADLTRGRTTVSDGHHGRSSPHRRQVFRDSRSLERGQLEAQHQRQIQQQNNGGRLTQPPLTHQPLSQPAYPVMYNGNQSQGNLSKDTVSSYPPPTWPKGQGMDMRMPGTGTPRSSVDFNASNDRTAALGASRQR